MAFKFPNFDYLDDTDRQYAQSQLNTENEIIGSNVAQARARALGRLAQRGLEGSGIAEQTLADLEQGGNVARSRASAHYNDTLLRIREAAKQRAFQRQLYKDQLKMQQNATFWNTLGDLGRAALFFGSGGLSGAGGLIGGSSGVGGTDFGIGRALGGDMSGIGEGIYGGL